MTIKAHFDGKVFVPDEPVTFKKGQGVTVRPARKVGPGMTGRELVKYLRDHPELKQMWDDIAAGRDSTEVAADLRRQAQTRHPSHESD